MPTVSFTASNDDGYVAASGSVLSTVINATTGYEAITNGTTIPVSVRKPSTTFFVIRASLSFDTSTIPDNAVITDAVLKLRCTSAGGTTNNHLTHVVQPAPAITGNAHYNKTNWGSTSLAAFSLGTLGDISVGGLGSTVNKTGVTRIGLRNDVDITEQARASYVSNMAIASSENATVAYRPVLEVTYDEAPTAPGKPTLTGGAVGVMHWPTIPLLANSAGATGYRFYRDGVLIGDQSSGSLPDAPPDEGQYTYTVVAYNAAGDSPVSDPLVQYYYRPVASWTSTTPTATGQTKFEFMETDTIAAGEFLFPGRDMSHVRVESPDYYDTGNGTALRSKSTGEIMWITPWVGHDKRKTFSFECEMLYTDTGLKDLAFLWYSTEVFYSHVINESGDITASPAGWSFSDIRNKWVKVGYRYVIDPATGAYQITKRALVGGVWRTSVDNTVIENFNALEHPSPVVAFHTWAACNWVAIRNFKITEGELACYTVVPSRVSGIQACNQVKVNGQSGWSWAGSYTWALGNVRMYIQNDREERIYTTTNESVDLQLPIVNVPLANKPSRFELKGKNIQWSITNPATGVSIESGSIGATEQLVVVDISDIEQRRLQPIVTLTGTDSIMRWAEMSWAELSPPATPSPVTATVVEGGIQVTCATVVHESGYEWERSLDGGTWLAEAMTGPDETTIIDTDVLEGTVSRQYRVRAFNDVGSSNWAESNILGTEATYDSTTQVLISATADYSADTGVLVSATATYDSTTQVLISATVELGAQYDSPTVLVVSAIGLYESSTRSTVSSTQSYNGATTTKIAANASFDAPTSVAVAIATSSSASYDANSIVRLTATINTDAACRVRITSGQGQFITTTTVTIAEDTLNLVVLETDTTDSTIVLDEGTTENIVMDTLP